MRKNLRVAIVHEWLVTYAGSERALEQLLYLYPDADLFAVCDFLPESDRAFLLGRKVTTTFIQDLPGARKRYRNYLFLMPLAVEQLDLSEYDLVISSSHAVAKGVLTGPDQLHISYVYSPLRYAWDLQHQYLREAGLNRGFSGLLAKWTLHKMRLWDLRTANGVDRFVAISEFIARRIRKVYRRESEVIYPPVSVSTFTLGGKKEGFFLTASRLVPYKRVDLIVEAFGNMPDRRLVVIGDGPQMEMVRSKAGPNVQVLGHQPLAALRDYMQRAKAFVFAAEEDFGIVPVEAQACGTPVIAYGKGGALETVRGLGESDLPTGVFFPEQSAGSIVAAVETFERSQEDINPAACRANAEQFAPEVFRQRFGDLVALEVEKFWPENGVRGMPDEVREREGS